MSQEGNQSKRLFTGLAVGAVFGLGVGLLVGLVFAWWIRPLEITDVGPQDLREDYAGYYWSLVAESYGKHGNIDLAQKQLGTWDDPDKLATALNRVDIEASPDVSMVVDSLAKKVAEELPAAATEPEATAAEPGETEPEKEGTSLLPVLGVVVLIALVLAIIALLVIRSRKRRTVEAEATAVEETPDWLATMRPEEEDAGLPVLGHFVTSYAMGNDNYDESFSIETGAGEFLGECGVGISETIGQGEPDKVTAFEIWLFDKNDIRTVTKVLMSEHAFHDQNLRASLEQKGEAVLAQANEPIVLETATLRVDATITDLIYGAGDADPNSSFERMTVELVTHQKQESAPPAVDDEQVTEF